MSTREWQRANTAGTGRETDSAVGESHSWVRATLLATTALMLALGLVYVLIVGLRPIASIVTMSLNVKTEALAFELKPDRSYAWQLPHGSYSVIDGKAGAQCEGSRPDIVCIVDAATMLRLSGAARVRFEVAPARSTLSGQTTAQFMLTVEPSRSTLVTRPMVATVSGEGGQVLETRELFTFQSAIAEPDLRLPVIAGLVQVGAPLHESSGATTSFADDWQPILREGEYAAFANVGDSPPERYQLLQGELYSGDLVSVRAGPADVQSDTTAVWGHVTITPARDDQPALLHGVLHSPFPELAVTRFGAPDGYRVKVPWWMVFSSLPWWQAAWVTFVSLMLLFQVGVDVSELLAKTRLTRIRKPAQPAHAESPSNEDEETPPRQRSLSHV